MTLGAGQTYLKAVGVGLGTLVAASVLGWTTAAATVLTAPMAVLVVFSAVLVRPDPIQQSMTRAGSLLVGALYAGGLIPYLALLRELPSGLALALMALFCTWGGDTGAYFAGRFFGRHKLYPKISPAKTLEGAVGGLAASIGVAFLVRALFGGALSGVQLILIGSLAAVLGIAGDLAESMLKRSVGAKDSSNLIPGHGGVLDRFDAVLFVAPGLYVFATLALVP